MVNQTREPAYVPLTTNLGIKYKRQTLYFPLDFGELTLDGLVDTGALSNTIPVADLRKIRLLTHQSTSTESQATTFQILVTKGQLKNLKSFLELKFEVGDIKFHEFYFVMENLTSPVIGLSLLQRNKTILDMRQGVLIFTFFSMHKYTDVMGSFCTREDITISPNDRQYMSMSSELYSDTAVTGIIQPSNALTEDGEVG